jgi:hypothetical protein
MTHKIANFLLAHGRGKNYISRLKTFSKWRGKMENFALHFRICHATRHTAKPLFRSKNGTQIAHHLASPGHRWQPLLLQSKKVEKQIQGGLVISTRIFSLLDSNENSYGRRIAPGTFPPEMAYSLTPHFITLQNEAL